MTRWALPIALAIAACIVAVLLWPDPVTPESTTDSPPPPTEEQDRTARDPSRDDASSTREVVPPTKASSEAERDRSKITGRVVRASDLTPIERAVVILQHRPADRSDIFDRDFHRGVREVAQAVTNRDGEFEVASDPPSMYRLRVEAPVTRASLFGGEELQIRLHVPASLVVTVRAGDAPVADARLRLIPKTGRSVLAAGRSDASGERRFLALPKGTAYLSTIASGYRESFKEVVLKEGQTQQLTVELRPGRTVRGRVLSAADRRPVAGAAVADSFEFDRTTKTDREGGFTLAGVGGRHTWLFVRAKGFARAVHAVPEEAKENVVILLDAGGTLTGRLVDANGAPAPGGRCAAVLTTHQSNGVAVAVYPEWVHGVVDASGRFQITGLHQGRHYWLQAHGTGLGKRTYALPGKIANGTTLDLGDVVLRPEGAVAGRVVDATGRPRRGILMALSGVNADSRRYLQKGGRPESPYAFTRDSCFTDHAGRFFFGNVAGGKYNLSARSPTAQKWEQLSVTAEDGKATRTRDIVLDAGIVLAGQVRLPQGHDGTVPKIWLTAYRDGERAAAAVTEDDGRFRLEGLEESAYEIRLSRILGDAPWVLRPVRDLRPGGKPVVLTLEAGVAITGRVLDPAGEPTSAWVRAISDATGETSDQPVRAAKDGSFRIHVAKDFVGRLAARRASAPRATGTIDGVAAGQTGVEIRLRKKR